MEIEKLKKYCEMFNAAWKLFKTYHAAKSDEDRLRLMTAGETVLGNSIRNAVEKKFPWIIVRPAKKKAILDRIRCTVKLMGAGRFFITQDCKSLETAFSEAVWDKEAKGKDERLDDGSTDIDSLDAFEYTIERDMKMLIQEAEDV